MSISLAKEVPVPLVLVVRHFLAIWRGVLVAYVLYRGYVDADAADVQADDHVHADDHAAAHADRTHYLDSASSSFSLGRF